MVQEKAVFHQKGATGPLCGRLSVIVTAGLPINIIAAYFLIDKRLGARLDRIHLQANSTLDIIWPVIWKLSLVSVFFVALAGVVPGYYLMRRLDTALAFYLEAMKMAGQEGDLTVRVASQSHGIPAVGGAFNRAMRLLDERFGRVRHAAAHIEDSSMKELSRLMGPPGEPLRREVLIEELNHMMSRSEEALKDISIFRV